MWGVTHCTPVGANSSSLLLQVSTHSLIQLQKKNKAWGKVEVWPGEVWAVLAPDRP